MGDVIEILTTATNTVEVEAQGPQGIPGVGVPTGGSTGQVLRKASGADYATEWAAAGSGSGSVTSVALASTDLTISGSPITDSGTITANIAANAVTLEKLQTISSEHLLGRHGNGNGGVQQIGLGTGLAMSGSNVRVATTGITAGTYTKLTIDETGRATVGATATPSDIGAQSIFTVENLVITTTSQVTLTAARAKIYEIVQYAGAAVDVKLPSTNALQGDVIVLRWATGNDSINVIQSSTPAPIGTISAGEQKRFIRGATDTWTLVPVDTHTHAASAITSGTLDIARIPTGTSGTTVALGNHTHTPSEVGLGNVSNTAQVTSVSGTAPIVSSGGTTPTISITTGSTAGTVAAGDDSRITGAAQKSANLSDLASASTARTNLGLAAIATSGSASDLGSGTVPIGRLGASGTPSGSTYLAGDNSWKSVTGGVSAMQSIAINFVLN